MMVKYIAIRLRGLQGVNQKIASTLKILKLNYIHNLVRYPCNDTWLGRLKIVKDYITWTKINDDASADLISKIYPCTITSTVKLLQEGDMNVKQIDNTDATAKFINDLIYNHQKKMSASIVDFKTYKLHPPIKGYKNIKIPFRRGKGDIGERTVESFCKLVDRMTVLLCKRNLLEDICSVVAADENHSLENGIKTVLKRDLYPAEILKEFM